MLCPHCGKENASPFGYCAACQKPMSTVGGAMPALAPLPAAPKVMNVPAKIFLALTVLLALLFGFTRPVEPGNSAYEFGQRIGFWLFALVIPAIIAYLSAGRRKVRHPNRFVLLFCLIAGFIMLTNLAAYMDFETPQQRFARLMREAAGTQPESHKGFGRQRRFDDSVRVQYRKILQLNRDYMAKVKELDTSKVKDINKAEAFASHEVAQAGLAQLHALYDADSAHEEEVKEAMDGLRHIFESEDAGSPSMREAMLKGFDQSMARQLSLRQATLVAEKAWIDAVDEEHAYADIHQASLRMVGEKLVIQDALIRNEFNDRLHDQEAKRKAFLKAQDDFNKYVTDSRREFGFSNKDVGQ